MLFWLLHFVLYTHSHMHTYTHAHPHTGTPALTSRTMKEEEMRKVAEFIDEGVQIAKEAKEAMGAKKKITNKVKVHVDQVLFLPTTNWPICGW